MAEKHEVGNDHVLNDGVSFYPAGATRLEMYDTARRTLAGFDEPILFHADSPHDRLYVAALDGTGNDADKDPEHATNVNAIRGQIEAGMGQHPHIAVGYVAGAGTQDNPIKRALDGADGYTCEERAELMYKKFIDQAWRWKKEDPEAHISLAEIGFSRGADEVAIFARLVHERGIQNPAGAKYTYTSDGLIAYVEYTKPPLVAPGQVAQAVALMDPVGTGNEVRNDDRRLPPSVISGIQLTSTDERRSLFKSDRIMDPGMTSDGRFAGVYVPGAHSDVGGGYHRNGLSDRAGNIVIDYLNGLSNRPFLTKQSEPDDPRLNVVHRSEEGMFIYRITPKVDRLQPEGYNERLVPRRDVGKVADPNNAEPRDEALNATFQRQWMPNGPLPEAPMAGRDTGEHTLSLQLDHMLAAARNGDWGTFMRENQQLAAMDAGRELRAQAMTAVDVVEHAATRQAAPQAAAPMMESPGPIR